MEGFELSGAAAWRWGRPCPYCTLHVLCVDGFDHNCGILYTARDRQFGYLLKFIFKRLKTTLFAEPRTSQLSGGVELSCGLTVSVRPCKLLRQREYKVSRRPLSALAFHSLSSVMHTVYLYTSMYGRGPPWDPPAAPRVRGAGLRRRQKRGIKETHKYSAARRFQKVKKREARLYTHLRDRGCPGSRSRPTAPPAPWNHHQTCGASL